MGQCCKSNGIIDGRCRSWYHCFYPALYQRRERVDIQGLDPVLLIANGRGQILDKLYYSKMILFSITQNKCDAYGRIKKESASPSELILSKGLLKFYMNSASKFIHIQENKTNLLQFMKRSHNSFFYSVTFTRNVVSTFFSHFLYGIYSILKYLPYIKSQYRQQKVVIWKWIQSKFSPLWTPPVKTPVFHLC